MFLKKRNKSKKARKEQFLKGTRGAISIMLCVLLTPFLTITLGLVEYGRYQQVISITKELYEVVGMSTLSDYDPYIHDRFGLLAVNQENTLGTGADDLLEENLNILGSQVELGSVSVNGSLTLENTAVLKQQIVDFSELTATTALLYEDFRIEDLMNALDRMTQLGSVMDTVSDIKKVTDALTKCVEALQTLQTALENLGEKISAVKGAAATLAGSAGDLYEKLSDNGISLPEDASAETVLATATQFAEGYLTEIEEVAADAKALVNSVKDIGSAISDVKTAADSFVAEVEDAKKTLDEVRSPTIESEEDLSKTPTDALRDVIDKMEDLIEDTISQIKDDTMQAIQDAADRIVDDVMDSTGIGELVAKYNTIARGEYFTLPLDDDAVQTLKTILREVNELSGTSDWITYFKNKFIPSISFDAQDIITSIDGVLEQTLAGIQEGGIGKAFELLTELKNIITEMFNMEVFWDSDMNAFVNISNSSDNPYQAFLVAIGDFFTAVESFCNVFLEDGNIFEKLFNMFRALKDMLTSVFAMIKATIAAVKELFQSFYEKGSDIFSGNVRGLYEDLLISSYMRHNLPCRTSDTSQYSVTDNSAKLTLTGEGLTGFQYNNIARPASYTVQQVRKTTFQQLGETLNNIKNASGSDTMFKGAEMEYIRAATNSEIANQVICFMDIYFLRLVLNIPAVFMDPNVAELAASTTIACWIVYLLYLLVEPFCDMLLLVNGTNTDGTNSMVPLFKNRCWLTISNVWDFISQLGQAVSPTFSEQIQTFTNKQKEANTESGAEGVGLLGANYQTHLLFIIWMTVPGDKQIDRLQDLIELETAEYYRQKGKTFSMGKTYTTVSVSAKAYFNPFFDFASVTGGAMLRPEANITSEVGY